MFINRPPEEVFDYIIRSNRLWTRQNGQSHQHFRSFPITFTRMVAASEVGTDVSAVIEGDASGFCKLAEPILKWIVHRSIAADYANLKKI